MSKSKKIIENNKEEDIGKQIVKSLEKILKQCTESKAKLNYPHEGEERLFRNWLITDFLIKTLSWDEAKIVAGERFDILLKDSDDFPIIYIETKSPGHQTTKKEKDDFEKRISDYGSLRTAYLTDGKKWERLDLFAPTGKLDIISRFHFELSNSTSEEAVAFFSHLFASNYYYEIPRRARLNVSRDNPHILESLAADLHQIIAVISDYLEDLFKDYMEGKAGEQIKDIVKRLFDLWCEKSLVVSPQKAGDIVANQIKEKTLSIDKISDKFKELGFSADSADLAGQSVTLLSAEKRIDQASISEAILPAYNTFFKNFCVQSSHIIVARALLYRIGEDQNVFPRQLSGEQIEKAILYKSSYVIDKPNPVYETLNKIQFAMQDFLPTVYKLGEFDWWLVPSEKKAILTPTQNLFLKDKEKSFENLFQQLIWMLNGYFFGKVDFDVWRNIYQHYLPPDERQRLGGFYTPDELVDLVIDLMEYTDNTEGLCNLSFIDPACGSGAFVSNALTRLLKHLEKPLPCHTHLYQKNMPQWKRAEEILNIVMKNLNAIDIHPFAAFLTTINILFILLPLYVEVRKRNPNFSIDLNIFSADTLENIDEETLSKLQLDMFPLINSRIKLTEDSLGRYIKLLKNKFDCVMGNPPWGGVLKGSLAPIYDTNRKKRIAKTYSYSAQGKYDIYGLFMERAIQILKPGGRFGLLTQGSFIDKEWAKGLRKLLANNTKIKAIVDLNPFGQLFFKRMNIPCITITDFVSPDNKNSKFLAILSQAPVKYESNKDSERRLEVVNTIRQTIENIKKGKKSSIIKFANASIISQENIQKTSLDRWNLAYKTEVIIDKGNFFTTDQILEPFQGVTVGGKECLNIFLITQEDAQHHKLEREILHPVIKGRETIRWRMPPIDKIILYPYEKVEDKYKTAFYIKVSEIKDRKIQKLIINNKLVDALVFDKLIDAREQEIVSKNKGINQSSVQDLLKHRIALGLIKFPQVANYLIESYNILEGRIFKKKNIRMFNRFWYEYIWPRDPYSILSSPKIITPRLSKEVRFTLDEEGVIPQDSCICLLPTEKTSDNFKRLKSSVEKLLGKGLYKRDILLYCLAFLNSPYAQERLVSGHRPTPKGFYAITEEFLREIPIPISKDKGTTNAIIETVNNLINTKNEKEITELEKKLFSITSKILNQK